MKALFAWASVAAVFGAVIVRATGLRPPYWLGCAVGFLAVCAALSWVGVGLMRASSPRRAGLAMAVGAIWVSAAELLGLYTGVPFGSYVYTRLWLPVIPLPQGHFFPIALPLTWLVLGGAVALMLSTRRFGVVVGGVLLALIDFGLEPVLTGPVGFWRWEGGEPPPQNYLGWALVGAVLCWLLRPSREVPEETAKDMSLLLIVVLAGTIAIGLTHDEPRGLYAMLPLAVIVTIRAFWTR